MRLIPGIMNTMFAKHFLTAMLLLLLITMSGSFVHAAGNPASTVVASSVANWNDLNAAQKNTLAPLAPDWNNLGEIQKKKWVEIANRFPSFKPDEQKRIQERMRDWAQLTPEQRMLARENMARAQKLHPEQKNEHWLQYQQLSEAQKEQLAASASKKKSVTNLPSKSERIEKPLAPIKVHNKPLKKPLPVHASAPAISSTPTPASLATSP